MQTILVVEDERDIANVLRSYLQQSGYRVLTAHDGRQGLDLARLETPHLIILDLMLPTLNGLDVCRAIRRDPNPTIADTPIIILTARVDEADRLVGLELGADDYVTKPFSPREVVARVRTVLRRSEPRAPSVQTRPLVAGAVRLDPARREVFVDRRPIELTPTEYELLLALMTDRGRPFTRLELLERLQGEAYEPYERTIDVHIKNLRRKLGDTGRHPHYLLTVLNYGYKFSAEG